MTSPPRTTPLRVLHATATFPPAYRIGGPVRSLEGLTLHLADAGVAARVLTTDSHGDERLRVPRGWTSWHGVPVRYARRWAAPAETPAFAPLALVEARRADVVHVTGLFTTCAMQALAAARLAGTPAVLSPRGTLEPGALAYGRAGHKRAWLRAFGPLLRGVEAFHATADAEAASIRAAFPAARVDVVPNGTDIASIDELRALRAATSGPPVVGFVGRLHPIKALDRLVEAAALLRDRGLDFALCLVGPSPDPDYRDALASLAARRGLGARVAFPGELSGEAKTAFYARARVVVLPSHTENFGNVVVEALACETPVVASRGTPWEALEAWGAGRWTSNEPASLADAIEPYLRDAPLAARAGAAGRSVVEERYGWAAVARAMADVYRSVARAG